jgi:hypothetical protein
MGKASSAKKVARAARAGGGRRARGRREWMFPVVITSIVVLGVALIMYANASQEDSGSDVPPRTTDHFHQAFGIYVCDKFSDAAIADKFGDRLGIHTHGDNVIHVHPFQPASAGENATLSRFMEETGLEISNSELKIPGGETYDEGDDKCGGKDAIVQAARWDSPDDDEPEIITEDFGDIRLDTDRGVFTFAFAPEGTELPKPPSVPTLDNLSDVTGAPSTVPSTPTSGEGGSTTTAPSGSTTTRAGGGSTTTRAGGGSTTTTAP